MTINPQDGSRRQFLKTVVGGTAAVASTCMFGAGCGVNAPDTVSGRPVDRAGRLVFGSAEHKQLGRVGGAVLIDAEGAGQPVLVMRTGDAEYRATSGLCTHVACPVGYDHGNQLIECPCHGARFSLDGAVLRRPAVTPLAAYPVRVNADTAEITVDLNGFRMPAVAEDGTLTLEVANFGELQVIDGTFMGTPLEGTAPLLFLRYESNKIFVYDANCTFGACLLQYSADRRRLKCECHTCEFDIDGTVKQGPASVALKQYEATFDGTNVVVRIA